MKLQKYPSIALRALETFDLWRKSSEEHLFLFLARKEIDYGLQTSTALRWYFFRLVIQE